MESKNNCLTTKELNVAWGRLIESFPFVGYINTARKSGYFEMVRRVEKWAGRYARVLDFGAGPCDKTALFALTGMHVTAVDDLGDAWHKVDDNREKILEFAKSVGIDYSVIGTDEKLGEPDIQYDVIMAHDVLEHLHSSPRVILNTLIQQLKPDGLLAITVPNAANLRKRIHLLFGKTNYPKFEYFYWYPGLWRGHVREYVRRDLVLLSQFLRMELLELDTYHLQLDVLPEFARRPFRLLSYFFPGFRDSWMLIARKPANWKPRFEPDDSEFNKAFRGQYYDYRNVEFDWNE